MDSKLGVKIQASVSKLQDGNFDLEVGFVYKISSFKVIPNDRHVRLTNNRFRLLFNVETNIFLSGDPSIPREAWSFVDSAEIERSMGTFPHLIDFMGLLTAVSTVRRIIVQGRVYKMIVMQIVDPTGLVRCLLLGEMVDLLMMELSSNWINRPIVILQYFRAKYIRGGIILQNVPHFSSLYINTSFEAVSSFSRRLIA